MSIWRRMELEGWGHTHRVEAQVGRPEREREMVAALHGSTGGTITARGAGRSYGDAALNQGGFVVLTERLNRVLALDVETASVVCEAGVLFRDLIDLCMPHGLLPPVCPGTAYVSVGGAIANDIHGKNHDAVGSMGAHVRWLDLLLPSGKVQRVDRESDPELFASTCGGVGLTGIILRACLQLLRVPSAHVRVREQRISDLDGFIEALREARTSAAYSVGWLDGLARGSNLGRGILRTGAFIAEPVGLARPARRPQVPFDLPGWVLNPFSMRAFNAIYLRSAPRSPRTYLAPVDRYFFPLDAIGHWNRMYGKRGFYQFQCVLPDAEAPTGLRALLDAVSASGDGSFLNVLKTLGQGSGGYLAFPIPGFTLAIDIRRSRRADALMQTLAGITVHHGGRVYLAKDETLDPRSFATMYPGLDRFRDVIERVDPEHRMSSDQDRRLRIGRW